MINDLEHMYTHQLFPFYYLFWRRIKIILIRKIKTIVFIYEVAYYLLLYLFSFAVGPNVRNIYSFVVINEILILRICF